MVSDGASPTSLQRGKLNSNKFHFQSTDVVALPFVRFARNVTLVDRAAVVGENVLGVDDDVLD